MAGGKSLDRKRARRLFSSDERGKIFDESLDGFRPPSVCEGSQAVEGHEEVWPDFEPVAGEGAVDEGARASVIFKDCIVEETSDVSVSIDFNGAVPIGLGAVFHDCTILPSSGSLS